MFPTRRSSDLRSGTEMVGVLDVCDKLKEVIRFRHGVQRDLSPAAYMSVLRTGRLKLYGKDHDVSDLVTQAISEVAGQVLRAAQRSEEHTSELQPLMRISYAVFCLKRKT